MSEDNVTPITPSHVCASCKAEIDTRNVYEGHGATCMQPEVRIRRLEATIAGLVEESRALRQELLPMLENVAGMLDRFGVLEVASDRQGQTITSFEERIAHIEGFLVLDPPETHGISEASPDTQRSGSPYGHCPNCNWPTPFEGLCSICRLEAGNQRSPHADARAAEPPSSPPAGAVPAREEPGQS